MTDFNQKIIWITGASSGIGKALVYAFAEYDTNIIISARREAELERVKKEAEKLRSKCHVMPMDLSKPDEIKNTAKKVLQQFGHIDILINNGGISQRSYILETPVDNDRKIMEINYFSSIILTKEILPGMINAGGGHVVAISSIVGRFGFPMRSAYAASKHALHGFYETLRAELKEKNIKVSIIMPGRVITNISYNALEKDGTPHGKMDEGQNKGILVDQCAKKILKAIRKNKINKLVGGNEINMVRLKKWLPGIFYKIVSKINPT
jgi:dehydrogenase/reductase SDR family member 7B